MPDMLDQQNIAAVIDTYRAAPDCGERAKDRRVVVSADLEGAALYASCAISALLTREDATKPFRFCVSLRPDLGEDAEGDFLCDIDDEAVDLQIVLIPAKFMDLSEALRQKLFVYLAADAYVQTVKRINPKHRWGVKMPTKQMTLDALGVTAEEIDAIQRSIWN